MPIPVSRISESAVRVEEPLGVVRVGSRYRISPELTFLPSEFSKIRLQYNLDHGESFGTASSVWMQLEFGLGAHAAHKY